MTNCGFENWTGGNPDDWTINSGTVTEETTAGYYDSDSTSVTGSSSAKFVRSGSDISLSQSISSPSNFNDNILNFRARVKSTTKEVIRLRVTINSTDHYSGYNRGQERFEDISLRLICPTSVSSITVYVLADSSNGTAYVDEVRLMRNGSMTTASVGTGGGCKQCGSYNYY